MTYTPALGRLGSVRFYDRVVSLTRERVWRSLAAMYVAPRPGETIVDIGCGTGSLALLLARVEPDAHIIGLDPDPTALAIARRKGTAVLWRAGFGTDISGPVDTVVSSLVLHQCSMQVKREILAAMFVALRPGGRAVIADYGWQRTAGMRLAFRGVQLADGRVDTQPNADGVVPLLMEGAGFSGVRETEVVPTLTGSISVYVGRR